MKNEATFLEDQVARAVGLEAVSREYLIKKVRVMEARGDLDSPLEGAFWVWWQQLASLGQISYELRLLPKMGVIGTNFTVDFAVHSNWVDKASRLGLWVPQFCIELDGHGFHERTPEQVMTRDRRDRELSARGWEVQHYSYCEFDADPHACVIEAAQRASWLLVTQLEARIKREIHSSAVNR